MRATILCLVLFFQSNLFADPLWKKLLHEIGEHKEEIATTIAKNALIDELPESAIEALIAGSDVSLRHLADCSSLSIQPIADNLIVSNNLKKPISVSAKTAEEANAMSIGTEVFITSGLIDLFGHDTDKIAAALSHELAHSENGHSVSSFKRYVRMGNWAQIIGGDDGWTEIAKLFVTYLIAAGYTREQEEQADRLAVEYLYRAGYNPLAMSQSLADLQAQGGARLPEWLSNHPPIEERIRKTRNYAEKIAGTEPLSTSRVENGVADSNQPRTPAVHSAVSGSDTFQPVPINVPGQIYDEPKTLEEAAKVLHSRYKDKRDISYASEAAYEEWRKTHSQPALTPGKKRRIFDKVTGQYLFDIIQAECLGRFSRIERIDGKEIPNILLHCED